jgi:hypothetical protein
MASSLESVKFKEVGRATTAICVVRRLGSSALVIIVTSRRLCNCKVSLQLRPRPVDGDLQCAGTVCT